MTPEITVEIVPSSLALAPEAKVSLEQAFSGYFAKAQQLSDQASTITSPKLARVARLEVKAVRVEAEKKRKELKEDSLRMGKAIDGANNILLALLVPIEQKLEAVEKEEERRLAAEMQARHESRLADIRPYLVEGMPEPTLGSLSDEQFAGMLSDAKLLHEAKIEAARKAEAERIAREQAEAAERERVRLENERLKAEAAEREAQMKAEREAAAKAQAELEAKSRKEREAIEAKAKAEREAAEEAARQEALKQQALREVERQKAEAERKAREALEAEIAAKKAAEEATRVKAEAEAAKAARAPDKAKVNAIAATVRAIVFPSVSTAEAEKVLADIQAKAESFAKWIETQASTL